MAANYSTHTTRLVPDRTGIVAFAIMAAAIGAAVFIIAVANGALETLPYLFLLPWVIGLAAVMAVPSTILAIRGEFTFANPIVFATISYFFPAFVLGGIFLSLGFSEPYFLSYIQDAEYNLPLTIVLIGLGFISLSAGYFVPLGKRLGSVMSRVIPKADYSPKAFILPALILLFLGVINTVFAFLIGLFGYQFSSESNTYAGLIYLSTLLRIEAAFLLWLIIFRNNKLSALSWGIIVLLASLDITSAIFAGNRGTILQVFVVILLAYTLSGRSLRLRHGLIGGLLLSVGILAGMVYGTTFRVVKGSEAQQSATEYTDNIWKTFDEVNRNSTYDSVSMGLSMLSERLDIVSTLAVVVSNYEQLKPFEEAYGLDNNIWIDTTTFIIPRVIWNEKPAASDPRKYSDLYFNVSESSFAITPMGDLLRNYGVVGIAIGMFLLGIVLRFIYSSLIQPTGTPIWRTTLYFMLLTAVSYEGFYGTIMPHLFKVGFTALVGLAIVVLIARKAEGPQTTATV